MSRSLCVSRAGLCVSFTLPLSHRSPCLVHSVSLSQVTVCRSLCVSLTGCCVSFTLCDSECCKGSVSPVGHQKQAYKDHGPRDQIGNDAVICSNFADRRDPARSSLTLDLPPPVPRRQTKAVVLVLGLFILSLYRQNLPQNVWCDRLRPLFKLSVQIYGQVEPVDIERAYVSFCYEFK